MSRKLSGLIWAKHSPLPPKAYNSRPRGTKALGLRYEKKVAAAIPDAEHGKWFTFQDRNGYGWCQIDLLFSRRGQLYVVECKLSDYWAARSQIDWLYRPILEEVYQTKVKGIVVQKVLRGDAPKQLIHGSMVEAMQAHNGQVPPIVHWLGHDKKLLRPDRAAVLSMGGDGDLAYV